MTDSTTPDTPTSPQDSAILKPCPWCNRKPIDGKVALPLAQLDETMRWTAGCDIHYQVFASTREGALAAWNTRYAHGAKS